MGKTKRELRPADVVPPAKNRTYRSKSNIDSDDELASATAWQYLDDTIDFTYPSLSNLHNSIDEWD